MRSIPILLSGVLVAGAIMAGCADDADNGLKVNSAALTDECVARCVEHSGDEGRCAETCAAIGGEGCELRCTERGGEEAECTERCDSTDINECFDACIAGGGDMEICREACGGVLSTDPEACTEGDEFERDGVVFVCTNGEWVQK